MKSSFANTLIQIGKPATTELIKILNDTSKGIIAHFILSSIWGDELKKIGKQIGSRVSSVNSKKGVLLEILHCGFTFYANNDLYLFARQEDLEDNKKLWTTLTAGQSSR